MNRRSVFILSTLLSAAVFFSACGGSDEVSYDLLSTSSVRSESGTDSSGDSSAGTSSTAASAASPSSDSGLSSEDAGSGKELIYIYVCGAVKNPGVYRLPAGSRAFQALEAAGGLTEEADQKALNQAELLTDGEQITVLTKDESKSGGMSAAGTGSAGTQGAAGSAAAKININTADASQLMTLPGIGEARAQSIIQYREENGRFSSIEDIQKIDGIKAKAFEKIKDLIEV